MKTLTKTTALILITLLASLNIMATGLEFEQEDYIDDIPFNLEEIETQARYEMALTVEFTFSDEDYIDDIVLDTKYLTSLRLYADAVSKSFSFDDERYIDDIPFSTSQMHQKPSAKFYARALLIK